LVKKRELMAFEVQERFYHIGDLEALEEFRSHIRTK